MRYRLLDTETQNFLRENENYSFMINSGTDNFEWTIKSDTVKIYPQVIDMIELTLLTNGIIAFYVDENILKVGIPTFIGNINFLGIPKDIQIIEPNGKTHLFSDYLDNKDILLVKNNTLGTKSHEIERYAHMKSEIDLSIVHNVINSRYTPMIMVDNITHKKSVDTAIENNKNGKPSTVIASSIRKDKACEVLNITDVNASKNIENLSLIQETLSKRIYSMYGCNVNSGFKKAQQSTEEISNGENSAFIYVECAMRQRINNTIKTWFNDHNMSVNVQLGKCWQKAWKNLIMIESDDINNDEKYDVNDVENDDINDDVNDELNDEVIDNEN